MPDYLDFAQVLTKISDTFLIGERNNVRKEFAMSGLGFAAMSIVASKCFELASRALKPAATLTLCLLFLPFAITVGILWTLPRLQVAAQA